MDEQEGDKDKHGDKIKENDEEEEEEKNNKREQRKYYKGLKEEAEEKLRGVTANPWHGIAAHNSESTRRKRVDEIRLKRNEKEKCERNGKNEERAKENGGRGEEGIGEREAN